MLGAVRSENLFKKQAFNKFLLLFFFLRSNYLPVILAMILEAVGCERILLPDHVCPVPLHHKRKIKHLEGFVSLS